MTTPKKRVLTGSRPSGSPHLGNYFAAYEPAIRLSKEYELFFFLADFHALNEGPTPKEMRNHSMDMAATMLACGLDPDKNCFFAQSAAPEVSELSWILSCLTPYGLMQRSVAFKDAQAKNKEVNMGVFNYPILMAADILLYDAHLVPVGKDQKQHLEIARQLAQKFNTKYGDIFTIPEPLISDDVGLIPGTDGLKMSKSKDNVISIFASDKTWKKQIMGITTSSEGLEEPKNPDECTVFTIYSLLASPDEIELLRDKYLKGGYGFGHAKIDLLNKVKEIFSPKRDIYNDWLSRPDDLRDIMIAGSKKAKKAAIPKLTQVQEAMGLLGRPF